MIEERHFIYRLIKLQIQSITEAPVEVLRAGFRKDVKLMSIIPGKLKGQPHQLSFKFIRSANRLPMHPSSILRPVVEHDPARCLRLTLEEILWTLEGFFAARDPRLPDRRRPESRRIPFPPRGRRLLAAA